MSDAKKLVFYNGQGYPYNFNYNDNARKWEGKLLFDENSSDLYKTVGLYTFEDVSPISYKGIVDFEKNQIYNNSGISFVPSTYNDIKINDIEKVNSHQSFYTKWIYGDNINSKFPIGTIVSFSGVTTTYPINDFDPSIYFTVLRNKIGAIMVATQSNNSGDTFDISTYDFSNGTVNSHDIIDICEYKQELDPFFNTLYTGKKLSVVNSLRNDAVYTYVNSAKTYSTAYDFKLLGNASKFLELEVQLFTERPQLYEGNIIVTGASYSGMTITFLKGMNSSIQVGQEIIFTDPYGEHIPEIPGFQYLITSVIDSVYQYDKPLRFYTTSSSGNLNYFIDVTGTTTSFVSGDRMELISSGVTTYHSNRTYRILGISKTSSVITFQVQQPVSSETGVTYTVSKMLPSWEINSVNATEIGMNSDTYSGYSLGYLDTNILKYSQEILTSGTTTAVSYKNTIESFNSKYRSFLNLYGVDTYYLSGTTAEYFVVEGLYDYDFTNKPYFAAISRIIDSSGTTLNTLITGGTLTQSGTTSENYYIEVDSLLKKERVYLYEKDKLARNYHAEILFNISDDLQGYGFTLNVNDIDYYIGYNVLGTEDTIFDFVDKYYDVFLNFGIDITDSGNTLIIDGLYPDVNVYNLEVTVNKFSFYEITNQITAQSIIITGNELKSTTSDFLNYGLSTGMIIDISGSVESSNNKSYNIIGLTDDTIQLSYQGLFFDDFGSEIDMTSRDFLRKPRGATGRDIWYKFEWNTQVPEIFYYDVTGDQLTPYNNISTLTYTGPKPLYDTGDCNNNQVYLNTDPNKYIEFVADPKKQQTIFDSLSFKLERYEDSLDIDFLPEPLQVFLGFNSKSEGVSQSILSIKQIDNIVCSGVTNDETSPFDYFTTDKNVLKYWTNNSFDFRELGFSVGQMLSLQFYDTSTTGQTIFRNYDSYELTDVGAYKLTFSKDLTYFNSSSSTYNFVIKTVPLEIATLNVYGQTEIEDIRLDANLQMLGIHITHEEEAIFKESDIQEQGTDFVLLNKKRKEMLANFTEVYNYISSYKAMINAVNYFGYNDLQVYEYYRNIKKGSPLYGKLFRTHIPDMFDLSTEGWTEMDQIKDNDLTNYVKTNLFNLTYRITDEDGNNVNMYSIEEVQTKLKSLAKWLETNIIPLSSNIKDLTGVADVTNMLYQSYDESNRAKKAVTLEDTLVINYTVYSTLNFGTNYLIILDFYTSTGVIPESFTARIKTFRMNENTGRLYPVQYFNLLQTDLDSFRFNVDSQIDPFIYIEITYYNDDGVGMSNYQLQKFDERKNYTLVNNGYQHKYYPYIQTKGASAVQNNNILLSDFYLIDEQNNFWLLLNKFIKEYWDNENKYVSIKGETPPLPPLLGGEYSDDYSDDFNT